jgi:hypothetical protein
MTVSTDRVAVGDLDAGVADALKVFQHIGRFLPLAALPPAAIARVAAQLYQAAPATLKRRPAHLVSPSSCHSSLPGDYSLGSESAGNCL